MIRQWSTPGTFQRLRLPWLTTGATPDEVEFVRRPDQETLFGTPLCNHHAAMSSGSRPVPGAPVSPYREGSTR